MDILFAIRADYQEHIGGDTFQFLFTKKYLEQCYGVNIIVIKTPEEIEEYSNVQTIHVFNMQDCAWASSFLKKAKECGKKTILSTIYWDLSHSNYVRRMSSFTTNMRVWKLFMPLRSLLDGIVNIIKNRGTDGKRILDEYRTLLKNVDIILPNSLEEADVVRRIFGEFSYQVCAVPNAISPIVDRDSAKFLHGKYQNCILEVGRIEPAKNQMGVVMACMDNNIPIVFIGRDNNHRYYQQLKKLAKKRGNVYFLGELPQESIADYYKTAKVHVLPSFRESPGLVTLEAMYYGCNVVAANEKFCPIEYYQLDKHGYICDPYSIESIRDAIQQAYYSETKKYSEDFFHFVSYENVAKLTYEAYRMAQEK